ncbi:MauE/DoxX family redox-associated membrane protein [Chitinophaga sp. CF418]|uniref:MauE/DoxX family redox-associated membrane protein n=1 Tax=Chitinophaga sp. CF418 TaxID=1855287 RepID=UPI000916F6E5|nr:Methylamine utilisation protein MauE [Chitinophaga sp. CF418]
MNARTLIACFSYALFFLFVYAAMNKLISFNYYLYDLKRSPLLQPYATPIAFVVPIVEILVAVLLLPDKTRQYGLFGSLVLMALFTLYVIYVLGFTKERPCTCGGIIRELTWPQHLLFNIGFLALSALGLHLKRKTVTNASKIY